MKLPLLSPLIAMARAHLLALTVALLVAALTAGGFYGWRYYQYRQSSEYAFVRLTAALTPPKPEELALLVDFNTLSEHLAKAVTEVFAFFKRGPDQIHDLKNIIQTGLLKKFLSKEEPPKGDAAKEDDPQKLLQQPLILLPPDFLAQLTSSLSMRRAENGTVLISASIQHPQLKRTFPLILSMEHGPDGWVVRDLVNAAELAKQLRAALLARLTARHDVLIRKNAATRKRMNGILALQSCTASAGLLSDGKTLVLVAHVLARNTGDVSVNNLDLDATFSGPDGTKLLRRFLNTARPIAPGEDFEQRWSIELDGQSPQGQRILAAGPLTCSAGWRTLGLSNAEVLHIVDVPDILKACNKPGHNHPLGFCLSPIFQNRFRLSLQDE
ncbi:translation initiation factor IF-2 [Desulfovibrio sp. PG-178-WT-4]|uniref:Translation initiation factor IF-2 n=2 Tax=Desulfovibrio porci TaxID=2605782 RepID=A0A6L5XHT5_9BACT|nr:translation initiation factor IF-2 [Desulfovibrio porci]MSS26658.1 translation initiation factor IF-2 [Desulfovibrio porci]